MINISPLLFLKNSRLLGYKNGSIYIINTSSFEIVDKFQLFHSFKEFFLYRFKLIRRLLRLGIRTIIQLSDEEILIFANKKIYELNISTKILSSGYIPDEGVRALYFTEIESIEGFDNSFVFGGYLTRSRRFAIGVLRSRRI